LSTPLFGDIPADMTDEEIAVSRSTPAAQMGAWTIGRAKAPMSELSEVQSTKDIAVGRITTVG